MNSSREASIHPAVQYDSLQLLLKEVSLKCSQLVSASKSKKLAKQTVLADPGFKKVLSLALSEPTCLGGNLIIKAARSFVIELCRQRFVNVFGLVASIQQQIGSLKDENKLNKKRRESASYAELAEFIVDLILSVGILSVDNLNMHPLISLAASDIKIIPFLMNSIMCRLKVDFESNWDILLPFQLFLLNDPALVVQTSVKKSAEFQASRLQLISWLIENLNLQIEGEFVVLSLIRQFVTWNASLLESTDMSWIGSLLKRLKEEFSSDIQMRNMNETKVVFLILLEALGHARFNNGLCVSVALPYLADIVHGNMQVISSERLFMYALLAFDDLNYFKTFLVNFVRNSQQLPGILLGLVKPLVIKAAMAHSIDEVELVDLFAEIINLKVNSVVEFIEDSDVMVTTFGQCFRPLFDRNKLKHEGLPNNVVPSVIQTCFILGGLLRTLGFDNLDQVVVRIMELDPSLFQWAFLTLNILLKSSNTSGSVRLLVLKGMLSFTKDFSGDSVADREFRITRVLGVIGAVFDQSEYSSNVEALMLPFMTEFVSNSENFMFNFVQARLTNLPRIFNKTDDFQLAQFTYFVTLLGLLETSQSRQSRSSFLITSFVSFLNGLAAGKYTCVDPRALAVALKLARKMSCVSMLDPRIVWEKFVYPGIVLKSELISSKLIRAETALFVGSFRIVGLNKEGLIDTVKLGAVKWLIEVIGKEENDLVRDEMLLALSEIDYETIKEAERPPIVEEETEEKKEIDEPIEFFKDSVILNPNNLMNLSRGFGKNAQKLWVSLIDWEVKNMSRVDFLGTRITSSTKNKDAVIAGKVAFPTSLSSLAFFMAGFNTEKSFDTVDAVLNYLLTDILPKLPALSSLPWFLRSKLPLVVAEYVKELFSKSIDDQRVQRQLAEPKWILEAFISKVPNSPAQLCNVILLSSAIVWTASYEHRLSEHDLIDEFLGPLMNVFSGYSGAASVISKFSGNDDVMAYIVQALSMFANTSDAVNGRLFKYITDDILRNAKIRDGLTTFVAYSAVARLSENSAENYLVDEYLNLAAGGKRKLALAVAIIDRTSVSSSHRQKLIDEAENVLKESLCVGTRIADIAKVQAAALLLTLSKSNGSQILLEECVTKLGAQEPFDMKSVFAMALSQSSAIKNTEWFSKIKELVFSSAPVPAALKYESVVCYLIANEFDYCNLTMGGEGKVSISILNGLISSCTDAKLLVLLHVAMVALSKSTVTESESLVPIQSPINGSSSFSRFSAYSYFACLGKFMSSSTSSADVAPMLNVFTKCQLLPRVDWNFLQNVFASSDDSGFNEIACFAAKHVYTLTPSTKIPFSSPSLLAILKGLLHPVSSKLSLEAFECLMEALGKLAVETFSSKEMVELLSSLVEYFEASGSDERGSLIHLFTDKFLNRFEPNCKNYDSSSLQQAFENLLEICFSLAFSADKRMLEIYKVLSQHVDFNNVGFTGIPMKMYLMNVESEGRFKYSPSLLVSFLRESITSADYSKALIELLFTRLANVIKSQRMRLSVIVDILDSMILFCDEDHTVEKLEPFMIGMIVTWALGRISNESEFQLALTSIVSAGNVEESDLEKFMEKSETRLASLAGFVSEVFEQTYHRVFEELRFKLEDI